MQKRSGFDNSVAELSGTYVRAIVVDSAGPYTTLAAAVTAAADGDLIRLAVDLTISATVTINKRVVIDGGGRTITCSGAAGLDVTVNGVTVRDLTLTSTATTVTNNGLLFSQGTSRLKVRNVRFEGGKHGLSLNNCSSFVVENTSHSVPTAADGNCVFLYQCNKGRVNGVIVDGGGVLPASTNQVPIVYLSGCSYVNVMSVALRGLDLSTTVSGAGLALSACSDVAVSNSTIEGLKGADAYVIEVACTDIVVSNCVGQNMNASAGAGAHSETGDGIDIFNSSRIRVSNCSFRGNGLVGNHPNVEIFTSTDVSLVNVDASDGAGTSGPAAAGIIVMGSTYVTLDTCFSRRNQVGGLYVSPQGGTDSTNLKVIGGEYTDNNTVGSSTNTEQNGIYLGGAATATLIGVRASDTRTPKKQAYGLRIENTAVASVVVCDFAGNLTGTIQDSVGSSTVIRSPLAIVNADVSASAAIAKSKLASLDIVNADVNASAAIAKSKLASLAIVNADVDAAAAIAETKLSLASDAAAGTASRRTLGTGATQATAGNDARLSDTRTPTDATVTDAKVTAGITGYKILDPNFLATGEETFSRELINTTAAGLNTGSLRLAYFTARKTETITQAKVYCGATPAGATPTLIRIGVWTTDSTGALLSQVAATPSDTALLAVAHTPYTKSFSASFAKTAGQRYVVGILVVTGAAAPQIYGAVPVSNSTSGIYLEAPVLLAVINSQADLPSTAVAGSLTGSAIRPWIELVP